MESAASSIGGAPSDDEKDELDPDPEPVAPTPSTSAPSPAAQPPLPVLDKNPKKRASSAVAKPKLPKKSKKAVGPFTVDDDDDASMSEGPVASTSAPPKKVPKAKAVPKAAVVKTLPFDGPPAASSSTATAKPGKTIDSYFTPLVQGTSGASDLSSHPTHPTPPHPCSPTGANATATAPGPTPPESDREDAWTAADDKELIFQGTVMFKDGVPDLKTDVKWQWLAYQLKRSNVRDCRKRFLKIAAERALRSLPAPSLRRYSPSLSSTSPSGWNRALTIRHLQAGNGHASRAPAPGPVPAPDDSDTTPKKSKTSAASSRRSTKEPVSKPSSTASSSKGKGKATAEAVGSGEAPKSKKRPSSAALEGVVGKKSKA